MSVRTDPLPGQCISETIRLKKQIGVGGMATIWLAEDSALMRDVAVKFLSEGMCDRDEALERFHQEAGAVALIDSPHVPKVYGEGAMPDGTPFIVMELLTGVDLEAHLAAHGKLTLSQTELLLSQLVAAVSAAHAIGIVHRDIKPENIFLTGPFLSDDHANVVAKLLDFGIAKVGIDGRRGLTNPGFVMGTPSYMSPEQLVSSAEVDEKTDLWSLGVVVYFALAGRLPFQGRNFGAIYASICSREFPLISVLRPGLPEALDGWFRTALHHDPSARFQTASEMASAFGVAARRPSAVALLGGTTRRWSGGSRACVIGAAASVAALLVWESRQAFTARPARPRSALVVEVAATTQESAVRRSRTWP